MISPALPNLDRLPFRDWECLNDRLLIACFVFLYLFLSLSFISSLSLSSRTGYLQGQVIRAVMNNERPKVDPATVIPDDRVIDLMNRLWAADPQARPEMTSAYLLFLLMFHFSRTLSLSLSPNILIYLYIYHPRLDVFAD